MTIALHSRQHVVPIIRFQDENEQEAVDALMVSAFGDIKPNRAVWHLRGRSDVSDLRLIAEVRGDIVGSLRFWEITAAGIPALLLGPLAVEPQWQGFGVGRALVEKGLDRASQIGEWDVVFVSGDPDYYPRFGFIQPQDGQFIWPGFLEPGRLQLKPMRKHVRDRLPAGPVALLPGQVS